MFTLTENTYILCDDVTKHNNLDVYDAIRVCAYIDIVNAAVHISVLVHII